MQKRIFTVRTKTSEPGGFMEYNRFIGLVQNRARLTPAEAVGATRATLETLAERIGADEARHVAAQLPRELGQYLQESPPERAEPFTYNEFCERIAKREACD